MRLRSLEAADVETVASWMADPSDHKWLDFGADTQVLHPLALAAMRKRDVHCLRLFEKDGTAGPLGIVAISNLSKTFQSGVLWFVLGDKRHGKQGATSTAVGLMLDLAFADLHLHSVNAWAVEENAASVRILEKNGFRLIGRQRQCHVVDGRLRDRLLFDLLAEEHRR